MIELRYNVPLDIKQVFLETLFPADPLELGRVRDVFQLDHLAGTRETQQHHFRGLFSRDEFPRTDPDHNGRLYIKVFLVVRRQVRCMSTAVLQPLGSRTIFGSSVRSAKNLFVMCVAYWLTFLPVTISAMVRASGSSLPDAVQFAMSWIYVSSSAVNGSLYIALHSSVRRELRRYLPRCRRVSVAPASTRQLNNADGQRRQHRDLQKLQ